MKQVFNTSVGTLEVLVDRESRTISIYRFDDEHRAIAAAIENWDHVDLLDVLNRQVGVPLTEANRVAREVREQQMSLGSLAERLEWRRREGGEWRSLENAGIPLRFVAVLLDAVLVFFPLAIALGGRLSSTETPPPGSPRRWSGRYGRTRARPREAGLGQ